VRARTLRGEEGVDQRQERRAHRRQDRERDDHAPVERTVGDELVGHERQHQHDHEDDDEPDGHVGDDRGEGRLVPLERLEEEACVQESALDDERDDDELEHRSAPTPK
jgi:hypothetical protein